jgi:fused signal recognition particle receptor
MNKKISDPKDLAEIIVDKMFEIYLKGELLQTDLRYDEGQKPMFTYLSESMVLEKQQQSVRLLSN